MKINNYVSLLAYAKENISSFEKISVSSNEIYVFDALHSPNLMREVARLREEQESLRQEFAQKGQKPLLSLEEARSKRPNFF